MIRGAGVSVGKFLVLTGELQGRRFRLEPGAKIVLGREFGDLNFPDKRMSRKHCSLEMRDDGDHVQDLGSTNGTFVNDERVTEALLKPSDVIRVGFTEIEFLGLPKHGALMALQGALPHDPRQTIAFAPKVPAGADRRARAKSRLRAAKLAAMGKEPTAPERRLISAKGKFCEACGEAIFLREGAPDEGVMIGDQYLCRMCALIAEKQRSVGGDYLPSYAKIVGGRMPEAVAADGEPGAGEGAEEGDRGPDEEAAEVEIVEVDEMDLGDFLGPTEVESLEIAEAAGAASQGRGAGAGASAETAGAEEAGSGLDPSAAAPVGHAEGSPAGGGPPAGSENAFDRALEDLGACLGRDGRRGRQAPGPGGDGGPPQQSAEEGEPSPSGGVDDQGEETDEE
jgi:pSer/pThr/pTyr-binding forkhead associated (FHA) protein